MNDKLFVKLYFAWGAVEFAFLWFSLNYPENPILDFAAETWFVALIAILVADRTSNSKPKGKKYESGNAKI